MLFICFLQAIKMSRTEPIASTDFPCILHTKNVILEEIKNSPHY
jgi:hypothetical protein